jgi:DNA-directed RNA polymerase subunit M/transcription elongation factor TFIIS
MPDPATECHACGEEHADWEQTDTGVVDGPHHQGIIEIWECGRCGETTDIARR